MKKLILLIGVALISISAIAQKENKITLLSSKSNEIILDFNFNDYSFKDVSTEKGIKQVPIVKNTSMLLIKGAPELPVFSQAIVIPDNKKMEVEIVDADFIEFQNIEIAPSKGGIKRTINPKNIPYTYGEIYQKDEFFPKNNVWLSKPFIQRDIRGAVVKISPFSYNPVTKTLKIYKNIKLRIFETGEPAEINPFNRTKKRKKTSKEQIELNKKRFINYGNNNSKYTPLEEGMPGRMLIISHPDFLPLMQEFVDWKNQKGIATDLVDVNTIGGIDSVQIKAYIQNYYDTHSDFSYLLLVGDVDLLKPFHTIPDGYGESYGGNCDNAYGFLAGNDHYADIFVGRFSGNTDDEIITQVERTLHYEKYITANEVWMTRALLSASAEAGENGETGDDGESDSTHLNNIVPDLINFGYSIHKEYEIGGTAQGMLNYLNSGCGQFQYTGHGSVEGLGNVPFSKLYIHNMTNINKLPFLFLVGCSTGNYFDNSCLSERFLRANYNNRPTGLIATAGSIVSQYWAAPMDAQDEFVDVLLEVYPNNIKRTFGGAAFNGFFHMMDEYNTQGDTPGLTYGEEMADYWVIFGDPSVSLRTQTQQNMTISHSEGIASGATDFTVNCNVENALVSLTINNQIIGTGYINSGTVNITFPAISQTSGTMLVTVTGVNKVTYQREVYIGTQISPQADFNASVDTVLTGNSVVFYDASVNAPSTWAWIFSGGDISTSSDRNPVVTYDTPGNYAVTLTVTNGAGSDSETKSAYITVANPSCETPVITNPSSTEYISRVKLNEIDNLSTIDGGYSDFTSQIANIEAGVTDTLFLEDEIDEIYSTFQHLVWIDWNNNGIFTDDNEVIYATGITNNASLELLKDTVIFTVPANCTNGYKTLRIRLHDRGGSECYNPCGETIYGEVEDYTINVTNEVSSVNKVENFENVKIYPNPTANQLTVDNGQLIIGKIQILDITGKLIKTVIANEAKQSIDIRGLEKGIYFVKVGSQTKKIIKI
jgi:PKD repeat protein